MPRILLGFCLVLFTILSVGCQPEKTLTLSVTLNWMSDGVRSARPENVSRIYIRLVNNRGVTGHGFSPEQTPYALKDVDPGTYTVEVEAYQGESVIWEGTHTITLKKPNNDSDETEVDAQWTVALSVNMSALVDFSFSLPQTINVGGDAAPLTVNMIGFDTDRIIWSVNGMTGGNDEFGTVDAEFYTPPQVLPVEPIIQIAGYPEGYESFTVQQSVTLVSSQATTLLFAARAQAGEPLTLWATDGTANGTLTIQNIEVQNVDLRTAPIIDDVSFFSARVNNGRRDLWRSDGTTSGTQRILLGTDVENNVGNMPMDLFAINDTLFLNANYSDDGALIKYQFLAVDPDNENYTTLLDSPINSGNGSGTAAGVFSGKLFFAHNNYLTGVYGLYSTDGVNVSAPLMTEGSPVYADDFVSVDETLYFVNRQRNLVKTDGTVAGTSVLLTLMSGSIGETTSNSEANAIGYNGALYFTAGNASDGFFVWRSDGTALGTEQFIDLGSGGDDNPHNFFTLNNQLYFFSGSTNASVRGLWKTDGSVAGTERVASLYSGLTSGWYEGKSLGQLMPIPGLNKVFFTAGDSLGVQQLWVTDGTSLGTKRVMDFGVGGFAQPSLIRDGGQFLLFSVTDDSGRARLWRTDGTEANTMLIKDICPDCFGYLTFFDLAG